MAKNIKKRHWAFVLYPESAPEDWRQQLGQTGLQGAISPLHDQDLDPTGTAKKPHHHIILCYAGPTSYNVVKALTDRLGQPVPQALEQVRGYYRYLTHKDNPEKHQYAESDIKPFGGFDISAFVELSASEVLAIKTALHTLIREKGMTEYATFMDYVQDNLDKNSYDVATRHTLLFSAYLKSKRHIFLQEVSQAARPFRGVNTTEDVLVMAENSSTNTDKEGENEENRVGSTTETGATNTETGATNTETGATNTETNTEAEPLVFWYCCPNCGLRNLAKWGKTLAGAQRFKCGDCGKVFTVTSRALQK